MSLFTYSYYKKFIDMMIDDIGANSYYFFISKHTPWSDEETPPTEDDSRNQWFYNPHKEMLIGKKVKNSDVTYMIDKNVWASNTVYAKYDNESDMSNTFFVINSYDDVFKCLDNNNGGVSTVEPTSKSTSSFTLADGYKWKYMYSMSSANATKFETSTYIPYDANSSVIAAAVDGSIEVIKVDAGGNNYTGYLTGTIQSVVNSTVFGISSDASSVNNYYTTSGFYVSSGTGLGSISEISEYWANTSGKFVKVSNSMSLDLTSQFIISPKVVITGDGSNASAYSIVNTYNYSIHKVVPVDIGSNYNYANVTFQANSIYGSGARATPIISPPGGHGYNPVEELQCNTISFSVNMNNSESNTVPTDISFRIAGLLVNPMANSSTVYTSNTFDATTTFTITRLSGSYSLGEEVVGQTTGAKGIVCRANSTVVGVTVDSGSFANAEYIIGGNTAAISQIININTSDIVKYSGSIIYYDNVIKVDRSESSKETLQLIIKI